MACRQSLYIFCTFIFAELILPFTVYGRSGQRCNPVGFVSGGFSQDCSYCVRSLSVDCRSLLLFSNVSSPHFYQHINFWFLSSPFSVSSLFFWGTLRKSITASVATDCTSYCYYQGIWLWWPLMSQQTGEEGNQRRSSNSPSLQMEVSLLLWSAICLWSDSSTVWVWKWCQHWVINATKCFPNVARNGAAG